MRRLDIVEKIRLIIREVAPDAEIILFGSEARGEARKDSDFDILILENADKITIARRKEITYPLYMFAYSEGLDIQPLVRTKTEWENRPFPTAFLTTYHPMAFIYDIS